MKGENSVLVCTVKQQHSCSITGPKYQEKLYKVCSFGNPTSRINSSHSNSSRCENKYHNLDQWFTIVNFTYWILCRHKIRQLSCTANPYRRYVMIITVCFIWEQIWNMKPHKKMLSFLSMQWSYLVINRCKLWKTQEKLWS